MPSLDTVFWENPLRDWLIALAITLVVALGVRLLLKFVVSRMQKLARKTANYLDDSVLDALSRTTKLTLLAMGVAVARPVLEFDPGVHIGLSRTLIVVLLVQVGLWTGHVARSWLNHYRERQLESDRATATAVGTISFVVQTATWTMVLMVILSNLGVNITALITGLGVGGIAVALALQNVFSDLFASLSIVFDKPFVIGDFLIVGEHLGTVENVGLKTTRIRSLSGEQLVFSNSDLLNSRLRNFGRMAERRVVFRLGVTYQTGQEQLRRIPDLIRETIEAEEPIRFDRSHFAKFGDFSLEFETVYYILDPDYNLYMDIQERINLQIRERFTAEGIEFAYPTQTLYVTSDSTARQRPDSTG